ncbi:inositol monophosphatase family protein [Patescibacteria group bacterium]
MPKIHEIPPFKEFAIGVAMRSGTILMRNFYDQIKRRPTTKKDRYELVTKSDMEVHRFVRFKIKQQFPDHNFLSEEGDPIERRSKYTWVVDPLDGTLNYTIANPFFATSLTLMEEDVPIIGVIYAPYTQEMFVTEKGRTTRLNERNTKPSQVEKIQDSVMSYAYFERDKKSRDQLLKVWGNFEEKSRAMRHFGCTSLELAYVACGRLEAQIISPPLRLWDVSAGMLMVEVAGGKLTNFEGKKWNGLHEGMVASNGLVHDQILRMLSAQKVQKRVKR